MEVQKRRGLKSCANCGLVIGENLPRCEEMVIFYGFGLQAGCRREGLLNKIFVSLREMKGREVNTKNRDQWRLESGKSFNSFLSKKVRYFTYIQHEASGLFKLLFQTCRMWCKKSYLLKKKKT